MSTSLDPLARVRAEGLAGQLENLTLGLDDAGAAHPLVLAQEADDVGFVLPYGRGQLQRDVLDRVDLQGVPGCARRERETCLRRGAQYVPDAQNSASPRSLTSTPARSSLSSPSRPYIGKRTRGRKAALAPCGSRSPRWT